MQIKVFEVDIYGKCGPYKCTNKPGIFPCDPNIYTEYKFYLAFENSICQDYVTEKLFNTMIYPIVPIVLGGADYTKYAPKNSFINVEDFKNPRDLAEYLTLLDRNQTEYLNYLKWKRQYSIVRRFPLCALCEMLNNDYLPPKIYKNLHEWWFGKPNQKICTPGNKMPYF